MKYLSSADLAARYSLNEDHVRNRLTKRKDFPQAFRFGGVLRWREEDIADWEATRVISQAARKSRQRSPGSRRATTASPGVQSSAQGHECPEPSQAG